MIKFENIGGVQKITEICDKCKCGMKDLTIGDIVVQTEGTKELTIQDAEGNEITRTSLPVCTCEGCDD
tara:strand:- start:370 stop:573 length:204 start_codon:yes stop_codon:yes gene_type:complete